MRRRTCLVAMIAVACGGEGTAAPWGNDFAAGEFPVGFRTAALVREAPDDRTRNLTLAVWYPAVDSDGPAVRLEDLFRVVLAEDQLREADGLEIAPALAAAMTGDPAAVSAEDARAALDRPTLSRLQPPAADGPFPLAVWAVRHATVIAQAPLAEVLASHGVVVATVWSSDPPLAFVWEDHPEEEKQATIDHHTGDLTYALNVLRQDPTIDGNRVVVLTWSYGGSTATRLQQEDDAVRAVIGLDASIVPASASVPVDVRRPFVYFVGQDTTRRGYTRISELSTPWITVRLPDLRHGNFNALEGYLPASMQSDTLFPWSRGGTVAVDGYRALVDMVTTTVREFAADRPGSMTDLAERLRAHAGSLSVEVRRSDGGS